jgi:hypothetical protein
MLIPVTVQLLRSNDPPGAKLWARAQDGSGRVWFRWYKNAATGKIRLATGSEVRSAQYSLGVVYTKTERAKIEDVDLAKYWTPAAPPEEGSIACRATM